MLHQRENWWEARQEPTWSRGRIFDRHNSHRLVATRGVLGVQFHPGLCDGIPGVMVGLGHAPGNFRLELSMAEAMELIELLAAAISDAHDVAQPFIDVTCEPCTWACCSQKAVR